MDESRYADQAKGNRGGRAAAMVKRIFVGRPISTHEEMHHRLTKKLGLAVFSSDALSSSAYATDEILLVLALAGAGVLHLSVPIAAMVAFVLGVVIVSYRQTVKAYPNGGGAYIVAHDNLGEAAGLTAASALLIDYILTVSVSVAAGVAAIGAAFPAAKDHRVQVALLIVGLITLANLRGLKESGSLFAFPTFGFLIAVGGMIAFGVFKVFTDNYVPLPAPQIEPEHTLGIFLILRAFASGSTALTGVEAISNGVPAFRPPESKNASQTLLALGILLTFLFVGITVLAHSYRVDPTAIERGQTVPSQIAGVVFGTGSFLFYVIQFFTAMILFLAANTSYADFPRLGSILAKDRYLPRVLQNRGDKLAFSNGIVVLAVAASAVLFTYKADVHRIIPLYVIGVFTSFTLSQGGMVRHWLRMRAPGWRRSALVNGFGAVTTFIVFVIVSVTKFSLGAWQVIILIPLVAWALYLIRQHYLGVSEELRAPGPIPSVESNKVVVLVSGLWGATLKALAFGKALSPESLHLLAFRIPERRLREIRQRSHDMRVKHPLEGTGHRLGDVLEFVRGLEPSEARPVTVIVPDPQSPSRLLQLIRGRLMLRIKRIFLSEPGVVVVSVPYSAATESAPARLQAPGRLSVIVLVSNVHRATLRALEYANSLHPSDLKALTVATETGTASALLDEWRDWDIQYPLEIVDSPYRSLVQPLLREVRRLLPNPADAVAVVIPEFILPHWWAHLLHGQTALIIKTALLFEPNVFVIDVPYRIGDKDRALPS